MGAPHLHLVEAPIPPADLAEAEVLIARAGDAQAGLAELVALHGEIIAFENRTPAGATCGGPWQELFERTRSAAFALEGRIARWRAADAGELARQAAFLVQLREEHVALSAWGEAHDPYWRESEDDHVSAFAANLLDGITRLLPAGEAVSLCRT